MITIPRIANDTANNIVIRIGIIVGISNMVYYLSNNIYMFYSKMYGGKIVINHVRWTLEN